MYVLTVPPHPPKIQSKNRAAPRLGYMYLYIHTYDPPKSQPRKSGSSSRPPWNHLPGGPGRRGPRGPVQGRVSHHTTGSWFCEREGDGTPQVGVYISPLLSMYVLVHMCVGSTARRRYVGMDGLALVLELGGCWAGTGRTAR